MVSPVLTENYYSGAFLVSEAGYPGRVSRENGVINNNTAAQVVFQGGLVLSQNALGTPVAAATGNGANPNTGNGTVTPDATAPVASNGQLGAYTIRFTSPTAYVVNDPNGNQLGTGAVGTAFTDQVKFNVAAGATAFAAGDSFSLTVPPGDGSYTPYTGTLPAVGLLFNLVMLGAASSRKIAVIRRLAEVNAAEVQWDPSVVAAPNMVALQAQAVAQLQAASILFR